MTKQEAVKAKKQLKDNSLPPALSARSQDRKLRKQTTRRSSVRFLIYANFNRARLKLIYFGGENQKH